MILLENDHVSISFNQDTGRIKRLYDKKKNLEYVHSGMPSPPYRIVIDEKVESHFQHFIYKRLTNHENGYLFIWEITNNLTLLSKVTLENDSNEITFTCEVINQSLQSVSSIEYPIISNLSKITSNGVDDYLAHSFATGFLIRNPSENFNDDLEGFRYMPYPESFSGSTMQFLTYYGKNKGGLYFAAYDGEGYSKWLNFYKNENRLLEASFIHGCEDIGPHKGIHVNYPIVVKLLNGQGWYEAANIYKKWAVEQFWCQKGKLANVDEKIKSQWLMEEIGVATFGINAGYDRSAWLKKYHEHIETSMFHILGPDWPKTTQNFTNNIPGGFDDWFPTQFNEENLKTIHSLGDKFAPFEFDYLFNVNGADGNKGEKSLQNISGPLAKSIDKYHFPFICPVDSFTQELHVLRDEKLQNEVNVDSIYYDISANNILKVCMDRSHGHPIGAGRQVTHAYRHNYMKTKEAMIQKAEGRYIPMGTEMMNEIFLDVLDYYQARAGGQPAAPLEGWNIRELLKSGVAELIPMFTYVYHEYGAIRIDGWGKLVEEIGDLFYFTVARTYLWGGIYELNYEYSPMEMMNGVENSGSEHYYPFEPQGYSYSSKRAKYINKFATLRTGVGNKYLAYGKMLEPLEFECKNVELGWFHYNCNKNFPEYKDFGELKVKSILHSAWQAIDDKVGLFFANVSEENQQININLDLMKPYLNGDMITANIYIEKEISESLILKNQEGNIDLNIPFKGWVLVELS